MVGWFKDFQDKYVIVFICGDYLSKNIEGDYRLLVIFVYVDNLWWLFDQDDYLYFCDDLVRLFGVIMCDYYSIVINYSSYLWWLGMVMIYDDYLMVTIYLRWLFIYC